MILSKIFVSLCDVNSEEKRSINEYSYYNIQTVRVFTGRSVLDDAKCEPELITSQTSGRLPSCFCRFSVQTCWQSISASFSWDSHMKISSSHVVFSSFSTFLRLILTDSGENIQDSFVFVTQDSNKTSRIILDGVQSSTVGVSTSEKTKIQEATGSDICLNCGQI